MDGEEASSMYLIDCAFAWNAGGGDCFPLCLEQATGHIAYSKRVRLCGAMAAEDSEAYRASLAHIDAELESATADEARGGPIAEIRMGRSRIVTEWVESCRNCADVISLRWAGLSRNYWATQ